MLFSRISRRDDHHWCIKTGTSWYINAKTTGKSGKNTVCFVFFEIKIHKKLLLAKKDR